MPARRQELQRTLAAKGRKQKAIGQKGSQSILVWIVLIEGSLIGALLFRLAHEFDLTWQYVITAY